MTTRIFTAVLVSLLSFAASAEVWQGRYGVGETFGFKLYNADGTLDVDEADGGAEVSLSCNEGTETTATNDFVDEGTTYSITLTNAEMQCERIVVVIAATTTEAFFIQTTNHASAMNPMVWGDLQNIAGAAVSTSTAQLGVNVVNFGGSAGTFSSGRPEVNTTHAAGTAWGSGAITAASIATDAIGAAEVAAGAIAADAFASGAIDATAIAADAIGASELAADAIGSSEVATDAIGAAEIAASAIAAAEVADGAIDEATFATTAGSFDALGVVDQGTAQAATGTTLQLRSAAAFADDEIIGATCLITGGSAGVGQSRAITDYVSSTDTATVATWTTTPTGTITYQCFGTAAGSAGSGATAAEVWAYGDRQLTALDEDTTTMDLNATTVGTVTTATNVTTVNGLASGVVTAAAVANGAIDAATFAADVDAEILSYLVDDATRIDASALNTATGTTIPAILVDTGTTLDDLVDDLESRIGAPVGASISADIAAVKTDSAAILVDTGTTLDGKLDTVDSVADAIKVKTDQLTFGVTNQVNVNVESMNGVEVLGAGTAANPWNGE